jgi:hypothetical protein
MPQNDKQMRALAEARNALQYVRVLLPLGAGNNFSDGKSPVVRVLVEARVASVRPAMMMEDVGLIASHKILSLFGLRLSEADKVSHLRKISGISVNAMCGNCSDQATVAFVYLYDRGVRPIDLMFLTNEKHAFVVIGREKESTTKPSTWGSAAIVCDPWNDEAYPLVPEIAETTLLEKMKCNCSEAKVFCRFG